MKATPVNFHGADNHGPGLELRHVIVGAGARVPGEHLTIGCQCMDPAAQRPQRDVDDALETG